jgi:YggT family protein
VTGFVTETTNPYLAVFRRFIPPLGMFDLSPILAILVLSIGGRIVVGLIAG